MTTATPHTNPFLDEIQQLFANGSRDDALELIDAYLNEYGDDPAAELLKAEMCLDSQCQTEFVGQTLFKLETTLPGSERVGALRQRVDQIISEQLAEGRRELRSRYRNDALKSFDLAIALAPHDPAVPLAAGMALLQAGSDDDDQFEPEDTPELEWDLASLLAQSNSTRKDQHAEAIEEYFLLAIENSEPGDRPRAQATRYLIQHWLAFDRIDDVLTLLETAPLFEPAIMRNSLDHAVKASLGAAVALLRNGQNQDAHTLLQRCLTTLPDFAALHLLHAESLVQLGQPQKALTAYRRAQKGAPNLRSDLSLTEAKALWDYAAALRLICPHCGKTTEMRHTACPVCDLPLKQHDLLIDRYRLEGLPDQAVARVGMAEVYHQQGQIDAALKQLDGVLNAVPLGHETSQRLQALHQTWMPVQTVDAVATVSDPVAQAVMAWRTHGLTASILAQIEQVCEKSPAAWSDQPFMVRHGLALALLDGRHLHMARRTLRAMFADNPRRKTVVALQARLEAEISIWREERLQAADTALHEGLPLKALDLVHDVLTLVPGDADAQLLQARARLSAGQFLAALNGFRHLIAHADNPAVVYSAQLGAALVLEKNHDFEEALAQLARLDGSEAQTIRGRLERRQRGEPFVRIQATESLVMHDTLARQTATPGCYGFFAVAVRAVGRPWAISTSDWTDRILSAGFEFVQVLGGLRNTFGDPLFALRLISTPYPPIPERGRLDAAFVVRVSAPDASACQTLAVGLWQTLARMLPLVQEHVYTFEPVADAAELDRLMMPFEPVSIAEIVRREDVPQQENDRYAVYPFMPGALDLHNLCWTLLRQSAPTMLSIHLLPTDFMAWERAAFDQLMVGEKDRVSAQVLEVQGSFKDPVAQWWQEMAQWGPAQANRYLIDTLRNQAYVLRVNVASSREADTLLPEMVASSLFGPSRQVNGVLYGGYEVARAETTAETDTARRNLAVLDVEQWVYSAAPGGMARLRHMVGEQEAALVFRLPIPGRDGLPGLATINAKPIAPPAGLPLRGTVLGKSITSVGGAPFRITQSMDDRRRHMYVVGKTGTGKSTLLQNMALQDIEAGWGVCVVDPHGDLVEDILLRIPSHRANDVILFDPGDGERPIGLNLLEAEDETAKHRIVSEFIGLLMRMYDPHQQGIVGPRFQHNVRNAMLTAMAVEGSTLIEVVRVLTDIKYVRDILPQVADPIVRNYWEKQIANTSDFHKSEILDYLVSKFNRFVGDSRIRNIIGQRHTTLDYRQIMDERKVLLVNLSKGKVGPESAQFLGLLLVQGMLITALSRANRSPEARQDFFLYVDEFQNFATDLFATVLSEGRKYGIAVTVANQYLTQLDHSVREAIFGNVGSVISFRVGPQDAAALAPEVYPVFAPDDLLNLPKFTACIKLLVDGVAARPFTMQTLADTRPPDPKQAAAIRQVSRLTYGRDAAEVTKDVLARFVGM